MDLMQLSDLLDNNDNREIDLSKTRIKVTNFMDNQYQQLKYLANTSPLQSVSYDNVRVQTSQSNSIEDKTIRQLQAKEYLRIIDDCINSLDDIKKTIFKARFIKNLYYWQIEQILKNDDVFSESYVETGKRAREALKAGKNAE